MIQCNIKRTVCNKQIQMASFLTTFTYVHITYPICQNKRPGRLIFRSKKQKFQNPSVLCTPPFEKSPIKSHRFCVLPPVKISEPIKPYRFCVLPPLKISEPIKSHRFCVLPPLKNHCLGWAFILENTVYNIQICRNCM